MVYGGVWSERGWYKLHKKKIPRKNFKFCFSLLASFSFICSGKPLTPQLFVRSLNNVEMKKKSKRKVVNKMKMCTYILRR